MRLAQNDQNSAQFILHEAHFHGFASWNVETSVESSKSLREQACFCECVHCHALKFSQALNRNVESNESNPSS